VEFIAHDTHTKGRKRRAQWFILVAVVALPLLFISTTRAEHGPAKSRPEATNELTLLMATTCEGISDHSPRHVSVVFSASLGEIYCFTSFDPVPRKTFIYHNWFFRDKEIAHVKLSLRPPRWSTFSKIGIRANDKGPWRIEIVNSHGKILKILRFSVVD